MNGNHPSDQGTDRMRVGIVGVGSISPAYIKGCRMFDVLDLVACADLDRARAEKVATENNIPNVYTVDQLMADPHIDAVINLTIPAAHARVSLRAIEAGKHVYSEKPLATNVTDGRAILDAAQAKGVRVGCAPDTFLFGQHQTARQILDQGVIGKAIAGTAFFASHGPERFHSSPEFFYKAGGGPMFDMGPYYVTCLINLLGPAVRVTGAAAASFPTRIDSQNRTITVDVPTHYTGTIEFASGAIVTVLISFDIWAHRLPGGMALYGDSGTLIVPDPNGYDPRTVETFTLARDWEIVSNRYPAEWARGIGLADMAYAIQESRPHRASGDLAFHALEIMFAFETAYTTGAAVTLTSTVARPEALPINFAAPIVAK